MKTEEEICAEIDRLNEEIDNEGPFYSCQDRIDALEWVLEDSTS